MRSKRLFITAVVVSCLAAAGFAGYLFVKETSTRQIPVYGQAPMFEFTDSEGKLFNTRQLSGKIWVTDFFFTTCGSICPVMTANMAKLYRSYKLEDDVAFVSVTVNPETDTPERLREYAAKFDADPAQWHFLTGDREEITRVAVNGFKVGSVDEPVFHSSYFILVDRRGRIRGYYDSLDQRNIRAVFKDIAQLLKEGRREP